MSSLTGECPVRSRRERRRRLQWKNQVVRVAGTKKGGGLSSKDPSYSNSTFPEEGAVITPFLRDAFTRITLQREQRGWEVTKRHDVKIEERTRSLLPPRGRRLGSIELVFAIKYFERNPKWLISRGELSFSYVLTRDNIEGKQITIIIFITYRSTIFVTYSFNIIIWNKVLIINLWQFCFNNSNVKQYLKLLTWKIYLTIKF